MGEPIQRHFVPILLLPPSHKKRSESHQLSKFWANCQKYVFQWSSRQLPQQWWRVSMWPEEARWPTTMVSPMWKTCRHPVLVDVTSGLEEISASAAIRAAMATILKGLLVELWPRVAAMEHPNCAFGLLVTPEMYHQTKDPNTQKQIRRSRGKKCPRDNVHNTGFRKKATKIVTNGHVSITRQQTCQKIRLTPQQIWE